MLWRIGEIFSKTLEELEPYLVQFDENGKILDKLWSKGCQVGGDDRRPVIVITHDECVFSSNDGPRFTWQGDGNSPLLRAWTHGVGVLTPFFSLELGHSFN
jgi:hypothetical protein